MSNLIIRQNNVESVTTAIISALYDSIVNESPSVNIDVEGSIISEHAYEEEVLYLRNRFLNFNINITNGYYIKFEDPIVERLCALAFGDGVGCTSAQLAAVSNQNDMRMFKDRGITNFKELKYFTNITTIGYIQYSNYSYDGITYSNGWFRWSRGNESTLESIDLSNMAGVAEDAFNNCRNLAYVGTIRGVVDPTAFWNCVNLNTDLSQITSLGQRSFRNTGITEVNCPLLTSIDKAAFAECQELVSVWDLGTILVLTSLDWDYNYGPPFNANPKLERVILPATVTDILQHCFRLCPKLKYIKLLATTPPTLSGNYNSEVTWYVPDVAYNDYQQATNWSTIYSNGKLKQMSQFATDFPNEPSGPTVS